MFSWICATRQFLFIMQHFCSFCIISIKRFQTLDNSLLVRRLCLLAFGELIELLTGSRRFVGSVSHTALDYSQLKINRTARTIFAVFFLQQSTRQLRKENFTFLFYSGYSKNEIPVCNL